MSSRPVGSIDGRCGGSVVLGTAHEPQPMRAVEVVEVVDEQAEVIEGLRAELAASAHREVGSKHRINDLERSLKSLRVGRDDLPES